MNASILVAKFVFEEVLFSLKGPMDYIGKLCIRFRIGRRQLGGADSGASTSGFRGTAGGQRSSKTAGELLERMFGYRFMDGKLTDVKTLGPFEFNERPMDRDYNQKRYEAIGRLVDECVFEMLEDDTNLEKVMIPLSATRGDPRGFVFASPNLDQATKLMVIIHGSGVVRAGQWSRRLIINESTFRGTQLPFIEAAQNEGFAVLVMNSNQNRDRDGRQIQNSESPERHACYVWKHLIGPARNVQKIAIVAHSYGGVLTTTLARKFFDDFHDRVFAVALTDSVHSALSHDPDVMAHLRQVGRNWVSHSDPLDTPVSRWGRNDIPAVSAGTSVHEETSYMSIDSIFKFIAQKDEEWTDSGGRIPAHRTTAGASSFAESTSRATGGSVAKTPNAAANKAGSSEPRAKGGIKEYFGPVDPPPPPHGRKFGGSEQGAAGFWNSAAPGNGRSTGVGSGRGTGSLLAQRAQRVPPGLGYDPSASKARPTSQLPTATNGEMGDSGDNKLWSQSNDSGSPGDKAPATGFSLPLSRKKTSRSDAEDEASFEFYGDSRDLAGLEVAGKHRFSGGLSKQEHSKSSEVASPALAYKDMPRIENNTSPDSATCNASPPDSGLATSSPGSESANSVDQASAPSPASMPQDSAGGKKRGRSRGSPPYKTSPPWVAGRGSTKAEDGPNGPTVKRGRGAVKSRAGEKDRASRSPLSHEKVADKPTGPE